MKTLSTAKPCPNPREGLEQHIRAVEEAQPLPHTPPHYTRHIRAVEEALQNEEGWWDIKTSFEHGCC